MTASTSRAGHHCPACGAGRTRECLQIAAVPVYCNVLYSSREAARRAPRGDIDLHYCEACDHLFNRSFDPARVDYTVEYENSLHYSGQFRAYAQSLAESLIERYSLRQRTVLEIACGKGDFLELLCRLGPNTGIGFDPSYDAGRAGPPPAGITFIADYYGERYRDQRADLICCRHALEHLPRPDQFLQALRQTLAGRDTALYFEVPNALFSLRDLAIWDLIYEHCGYFTANSLAALFQRAGFEVLEVAHSFGGQFLALHARPAARPNRGEEPGGEPAGPLVREFAAHYHSKIARWANTLATLQAAGRKSVIWGAGSKGVSFANTVAASASIAGFVDLNPHKQQRFVAGTGQRVYAPQELTTLRPDTVIVMNPLYTGEIRQQLAALGLHPEILEDLPQAGELKA